jgi:hypothetical protein
LELNNTGGSQRFQDGFAPTPSSVSAVAIGVLAKQTPWLAEPGGLMIARPERPSAIPRPKLESAKKKSATAGGSLGAAAAAPAGRSAAPRGGPQPWSRCLASTPRAGGARWHGVHRQAAQRGGLSGPCALRIGERRRVSNKSATGLGTFPSPIGFEQEFIRAREAVMATQGNVRRVAADAGAQGIEALEGVREVRDNLANAIDKSLNKRPYTTLLLAVGLGFLFGAIWTR